VIIFRYIARDILATTAAVSLVLMLVIISGRFVKYLALAAAGQLDPNILFAVIGYRVPGFLELILPLGFFLAILLVYGRMYIDSEMTVLHACGLGPNTLTLYAMAVGVVVALLVAWLSLSVSPGGLARADALLSAQKTRGELESAEGGKFYPLNEGRGVTYSEKIGEDGLMRNVFFAEPGNENSKDPTRVIVLAKSGRTQQDSDNGERYLVLENGYRVQGVPGRADFQITSFEQYGQRLAKPVEALGRRERAAALSTGVLLASSEPAHRASLQWRLSVPILVLVVTLIAVPLSRTSPRQGRFVKIFPAVILYILYLITLNGARGAVEEQSQMAGLGVWWVHGVFLSIAGVLVAWNAGWRPALPGKVIPGGAQFK
tara:strand:+ start:2337 stop:3458 length:1122 start_codon:yes stop_codon:yes gene_type:complete